MYKPTTNTAHPSIGRFHLAKPNLVPSVQPGPTSSPQPIYSAGNKIQENFNPEFIQARNFYFQ